MFHKHLFFPLLSIISSISSVSAQNAFPGAVGFGAITHGGNNGTRYHVTNLNDAGPGSLRDGVSRSNRYIVFDVCGYIDLKSALVLSSHITIDGTTAPDAGIGLKSNEVSASNKNDIIIRNIRMRQGKEDPRRSHSAFDMANSFNIIIDHSSIQFGSWDSIDAVKAVNFTISNCIIAMPILQRFGAHVEGGPATFYGNLWVSAHNRQPLAKSDTQFINNVVYNYQAGYTVGNTGGSYLHDLLNNYWIAGPQTSLARNSYFQDNSLQTIHANGNLRDGNKDGVLNGSPADVVGSAAMVDSPHFYNSASMAKWTATEAFTHVMQGAGASPRDKVDALAVSHVESLGTAGRIITNQAMTGLTNNGYSTLP